MNKYIKLIISISILFSFNKTANTQNNIVITDSLFISGIYKVILTNNTEFIGEVLYTDSTTIKFNISGYTNIVNKNKIKRIEIPNKFSLKLKGNSKFRNIFMVNASFNLPTGAVQDIQAPGFGIHASVYHLFDRVFGIGSDISYNKFYGKSLQTYYSETYETEGFSYFKLSANLIAGNFKPGNKFLIYGLMGIGLSYFTEGKTSVTYNDPYYYSYTYTYDDNSGINFHYGVGAGITYLTSKQLGINFEVQFNKLNNSRPYYYEDGFNGYYSFKLGCMFTK
jgi:hypothetical protein